MRYLLALVVVIVSIAPAASGSTRAFAQAPAPVPSVRAAQTTYVVGRDSAVALHAKDMSAACAGQPVQASFFVRNGAEPSQISAYPESPTAAATVNASRAADAQLGLPSSLREPIRLWPGITGSCLAHPVIDESLGIEVAVLDPAANPGGTSSIVVSSAGLGTVPNRPDDMTIGALVRTIRTFADGKLCTTVPVDPKVTGTAPVVIRLGASGQPAECSRAGAAITFTNADGNQFITTMVLVPGATRLLDNFAAGSPPSTSGPGAQPEPPSAGAGIAHSGGAADWWQQPAGLVLLGLAALVAVAALARSRRRTSH